jgi:hypothetical protein
MFNDVVIILFALVLRFVLPAAGIALVAMYVARRKAVWKAPWSQGAGSTEERLRKLGELRQQNLISDAEYEAQRQRIIASV